MADDLALPPDSVYGRNCGIVSTAVFAGVTYETAFHRFVRNRPRVKYARRFKGGTIHSERLKVLDDLGIKYKEVPFCPSSLLTWVSGTANRHPETKYMVTTTHHVQVVKGRKVLDQKGPTDIVMYWGKGKRIKKVIELIP